MSLALALLLAVAPPRVAVIEAAVDGPALERGLDARVASLEGWTVTVRPGEDDEHAYVELERPDGTRDARELPLLGDTPEDRSRALASELAYLIDQWEPPAEPAPDPEPDPEPDLAPETPVRRGQLLVGPRLTAFRSAVVAPGLGLRGGALLLDEHLLLRASMDWTVASREGLSLHGVRPAVGVGGGAALVDRRLWVGALLAPGVDVLVADDQKRSTVVGFGGELCALVQGRLLPSRRLLIELQSGFDLRLPPVRVAGQRTTLRSTPTAWTSAISLGVAL